MKNKLKVLWFLCIPLGWFIGFHFIRFIDSYPMQCDPELANSTLGMCIFLLASGVVGTLVIIGASIAFAVYMQE